MGPAIGVEASSVYGAYLDNEISTSNPINLTHMGGFLSTSKEMGYTYGIMETDESSDDSSAFRAGYLRQWRFKEKNEWGIALEVLRPL